MVLLGAGASIEAGIPGAYKMTQDMVSRFAGQGEHGRLLRFAVGGQLFQQGIRGENPFEGVNIEDVFNAIDLLAARQELEAAPFIGSWHPLVEEFDRERPSAAAIREVQQGIVEAIADSARSNLSGNPPPEAREIDRAIQEMASQQRPFVGFGSHGVGDRIWALIREALAKLRLGWATTSHRAESGLAALASGPQLGGGRVFRETNQYMTQQLIAMVWVENVEKVQYLLPLVSHAARKRMAIATLNYDNTIELAAAAAGIPLETGIEQWSNSGRFPAPANGVLLLKLHGSVDWATNRCGPSPEKPLLHEVLEKALPEAVKRDSSGPRSFSAIGTS
jgi:hypothetical protein